MWQPIEEASTDRDFALEKGGQHSRSGVVDAENPGFGA
jgi:hypothetical protein